MQRFMEKPAPNGRPYVLLTGATGLVGGLVLARLLMCRIPVAILVRGNRRQTAADRMESLLQRLEQRFQQLFLRPHVIEGDLTSLSGLDHRHRDWIEEHCGSIIHSAANLLFRPASEHRDHEPFRTNLEGTQNLLALTAAAGISEWHYVSTAYVAGLRDGRIQETECDLNQAFGNDYERSKALAEQLLRESPRIRCLTVYRPSIVIDLHPTTAMRSDQTINSAFTMFQALSQKFGLPQQGEWFRNLGFRGDERKNIVTVDWVSALIAEIWRRPHLHGRTYHLTSPTGVSAETLEASFRAAVIDSGLRLPALRPDAKSQIDELAAPFVGAFKPYFRDDPQFDRTNTLQAMRVCQEADLPELSQNVLRDFCLRQTRPAEPTHRTMQPLSRWQAYVADHPQVPSAGNESVGLEVLGPGGGEWTFEITAGGLNFRSDAAAIASRRWICSATILEELIRGAVTIHDALLRGQLLLETDISGDRLVASDSVITGSPLNQLTEFLRIVRHQTLSEVTYAG